VLLERRGSEVKLIACAQVPWSGTPGEGLTESLRQLRTTIPLTSPVILGVPTSCAIVTTVQPLVVNRKRAALAVQFELQQQLPYDVNQTVWHYQWVSANGRASSSEQPPLPRPAVVAAMKRTLLEEYLSACRQAGFTITAVEVACVAAVNAWVRQRSATDTTHGIVLRTDGSVLEWIAMTPAGLYVFPTFLPDSGAGQEQLTAFLQTSWNSFQEMLTAKASPPVPTSPGVQRRQTVWLLGELASSSHLVEEMKRTLACEVEVLNPSGMVTLPPPSHSSGRAGESTSVQPPHQFALACGLALQGLGLARLPMNLLAEIMSLRRVKEIRRVAWATSGLCALLAVALSASGMATVLGRRQAMLQNLIQQEQTYQTLRPEVRTLLQQQAQFEHRLNQLEELALARTLIIQAFQRLVEALPNEIWLARLELSKDGTIDGTLEGYSSSFQSLTRLMDQLKTSVGWTTVKPLATAVTTDPATGKELVAFTVQVQQHLQEKTTTGPE